MSKITLHRTHKAMGATFGRVLDWDLPLHYGDADAEHLIITQGAALVDQSNLGRLRAYGKDALDLINRLSSNKLEVLPTGSGAATVITTNKGRVLDLLIVESMEDHLLLIASPQQRHRMLEWIDFYTFGEDIRLQDITEDTVMLGIVGPNAHKAVRDLVPIDLPDLKPYEWVPVPLGGSNVPMIRLDTVGITQFNFVVPAAQGEHLMESILIAGAQHGLSPVGNRSMETARIRNGVPRYGAELSENVNPLEASLRRFVSFSKGCYVGQEVVARLDTYKKVQRGLMSVALQSKAQAGDTLLHQGEPVGNITSAAQVPREGWWALAYIIHDRAVAGLDVQVAGTSTNGQLLDTHFSRATEAAEVQRVSH